MILSLHKKDVIAALIIGEAIAWLLTIMLRVNAPELPIPADLVRTLSGLSTFYALAITLPILSLVGLALAVAASRIVSILYQAAKFILVGALNTFVDLGVLNAFILATGIASGGGYLLFKTVAFGIAILNSYVWNKYWTFESSTKKAGNEAMQFGMVSLGGFLLNVLSAHIVVNVIGPQWGLGEGIWGNIGALVAVVVSLFWNFFGYKAWVFNKKR